LRRWAKCLGLFFLGASTHSLAQDKEKTVDGTRWLSLRLNEAYVGTEVEAERESRQLVGAGGATTRERLFVAPVVGVSLDGSVYHPNLIKFRIDGEGGPSWEDISLKTPGLPANNQDTFSWLARGHSSLTFLGERPYATRLFADRARIYRDYDFFNRVTVDRQSYGAQSGYVAGPIPITVSYTHTDEEITGFLRNADFTQDTVTFAAQNERRHGTTRLSHTIDWYRGNEGGTLTQDNLNNYLDVTDVERLGPAEWITLNSHLYYNRLDSTFLPASSLLAQEVATLRLKENLYNTYEYSFDRTTGESAESNSHQGRASLRHQFYESLTSMFDVHAETSDTSGPGSESWFRRNGVGLSETYAKHLGNWGRLTLGDSVRFDSETRSSPGFILGETHTLGGIGLTFLNQPRVLANTLVVRGQDVFGVFRTFTAGADYTATEIGLFTALQRSPGSSIPDGGQVTVDYQVAPQTSANFSDSFMTLANQMFARLDLYHNLLGIYGRLNTLDNYGGEQFILQNYNDKVAGVDVAWRFIHAGAEHEIYDSNLVPFRATRLFQDFSFEPMENMTLGLDVSEAWTTYPEAHRKLTTYQVIGRMRWALTHYLSWLNEGGVRIQRGEGFDQDLFTARTALDFRYGQLSVQVGYDYQDENFLGELQQRHFAFLRARRSF
jgi:hypothetical protein